MIVSTLNASSDQEINLLIDLANKQIGQLSKTEELLIKLAVKFNEIDLSDPDITNNNPWSSEKWAKERTIRAEVIEWFFFNEQAKKQVGLKGIYFKGLKIQGNINLDNCTINFPFKFELCAIPDGIILTNSNLNAVTIKSSTIGSITAYLSTIKIVYLEHLEIDGKIDFSDSLIMKGLLFDKINITNKNSTTVVLNGTIVGGVLEFESFKSIGEVTAIMLEVVSIRIKNSQIFNPTGVALCLDGASIKGTAFLDQSYHAVGETRFLNATLLNLYMQGALMENPRGQTLVADGMVVKEDLRLSNNFKSIGKISLQNAKIGGSIYFSAGRLINPSGISLQASGVRIGRSVYFNENFISKGAIWFVGAHINSDLACQNATFNNPNLLAITLSQAEIRSICFDNNFKAVGLIDISGANITNILQIYDGADLSESILNLKNTRVKTLNDRKESWPANGNLFINGFIYEEFFDKSPLEVNERIKWIELQPQDGFKPQPYQQLAKVYKSHGDEKSAKTVLIIKNKVHDKHVKMSFLHKVLRILSMITMSYGYNLERLGYAALILIFAGTILAYTGFHTKTITPVSSTQNDTSYNDKKLPESFIFSLDSFIPLIDLNFEKNWTFSPDKKGEIPIMMKKNTLFVLNINGRLCRFFAWSLNFLGWIITLLLVTGITGVIKNET